MIVRESGIVTGIGWFLAAWGWIFTIDLVGRADQVTSAQWRYLMGVPGGRWAWIAIFGGGALILTFGQLLGRFKLRGAGMAMMGFGSLAIAVFYLCAPLIDPGLTTLGWHPWWGLAAVLLMGAVVNWKPVTWF